jgi:cysteine synthase A
MVCAAKGLRAHFVSSDAFAGEKLQTMRAFGATVEVIPIQCIALEPATSPALPRSGPLGGHRLEGMGAGFIPSVLRMDLVDKVVAVSDAHARETAGRAAVTEGLFCGITSGANRWAALRLARELGPGRRVVTVAVDPGLKYLRGDLFSRG